MKKEKETKVIHVMFLSCEFKQNTYQTLSAKEKNLISKCPR